MDGSRMQLGIQNSERQPQATYIYLVWGWGHASRTIIDSASQSLYVCPRSIRACSVSRWIKLHANAPYMSLMHAVRCARMEWHPILQ